MQKAKITLTGVNETLLVPLYARALESRKPSPAFYDATAVHIVESVNYDFEKHGKSKMNMWGCAARTVLFDRQAAAHIKAYPDCAVVNLACGLDDRFRRVDNGKIQWYNIDFPDVIELRKKLIEPHERVTDLACSALDYSWIDQITNKEHTLIIAEGFLMYLRQEEVKELFDTIAKHFTRAALLLEFMSQWMVKHQSYHDTTKKINVSFVWGVKESYDFMRMCPQYQLITEFDFTDTMKRFGPVRMAFCAPMMRGKNNRLACFEQVAT